MHEVLHVQAGYCQKMSCCCSLLFCIRTHLSEVSRVVLIHVDSVVMLTSSITATSWMFPVLANTSVTSTDVTPLFPVLVQVCAALETMSRDVMLQGLVLLRWSRQGAATSPKPGTQAVMLCPCRKRRHDT